MRYKKKPVIIEAFQYDGDFMDRNGNYYIPDWAIEANKQDILFFLGSELYVRTLEGNHHASVGDFIIRGIKGELYPCKPDIFKETYDEVIETTEKRDVMLWNLKTK